MAMDADEFMRRRVMVLENLVLRLAGVIRWIGDDADADEVNAALYEAQQELAEIRAESVGDSY